MTAYSLAIARDRYRDDDERLAALPPGETLLVSCGIVGCPGGLAIRCVRCHEIEAECACGCSASYCRCAVSPHGVGRL